MKLRSKITLLLALLTTLTFLAQGASYGAAFYSHQGTP